MYIYPSFVYSVMRGSIRLREHNVRTEIRTDLNAGVAMNRQAMGPTIRLQTKLLPFDAGMDILAPGTILFTNVTLQTWITYRLFFVIDPGHLPNERYVEDNRIGYFDFSPTATVSSDFYKFTFPDNIIARM